MHCSRVLLRIVDILFVDEMSKFCLFSEIGSKNAMANGKGTFTFAPKEHIMHLDLCLVYIYIYYIYLANVKSNGKIHIAMVFGMIKGEQIYEFSIRMKHII